MAKTEAAAADDMVSEGSPTAPEPAQEEAEAQAPAYPPYPGPDGFYSGSNLGGHLGALRERLGVKVPDGAEGAGLRQWDIDAMLERLGADIYSTEGDWARLWSE